MTFLFFFSICNSVDWKLFWESIIQTTVSSKRTLLTYRALKLMTSFISGKYYLSEGPGTLLRIHKTSMVPCFSRPTYYLLLSHLASTSPPLLLSPPPSPVRPCQHKARAAYFLSASLPFPHGFSAILLHSFHLSPSTREEALLPTTNCRGRNEGKRNEPSCGVLAQLAVERTWIATLSELLSQCEYLFRKSQRKS